MAAIKYQNISLFDRRGSLEGLRIKTFLESNKVEFYYSERLDTETANTEITQIKNTYGDKVTSLPVCVYESVYYESGTLKAANNEFSTTVSGFPTNFANAAVKTS